MKNILILDVNQLVYRFCFGYLDIYNSQGVQIGGIYGFFKYILHLNKFFKTNFFYFCMEGKDSRKGIRYQDYKEYKSNRVTMPDFIINQLYWIKKILSSLEANIFSIDGWEADDTIGSLAFKFSEKKDFNKIICTSDKDLLQFLDLQNVFIYSKKDLITELEFKKKYDISPKQFCDYLSLVGDASDAIPGIKGVGKQIAAKLLNTFPKLEDIFENLEKIDNLRVKTLLTGQKELALFFRKIVTINKNLFDKEEIELKKISFNEKFFSYLKELEIRMENLVMY